MLTSLKTFFIMNESERIERAFAAAAERTHKTLLRKYAPSMADMLRVAEIEAIQIAQMQAQKKGRA